MGKGLLPDANLTRITHSLANSHKDFNIVWQREKAFGGVVICLRHPSYLNLSQCFVLFSSVGYMISLTFISAQGKTQWHVMGKAFQGSFETNAEGVRRTEFLGMIRVQRLLLSGCELQLASNKTALSNRKMFQRVCVRCSASSQRWLDYFICSPEWNTHTRTRTHTQLCACV